MMFNRKPLRGLILGGASRFPPVAAYGVNWGLLAATPNGVDCDGRVWHCSGDEFRRVPTRARRLLARTRRGMQRPTRRKSEYDGNEWNAYKRARRYLFRKRSVARRIRARYNGTMMGDMRSSQLRRFRDRLFRERMEVLLCTDIGRREMCEAERIWVEEIKTRSKPMP